jgi:hypothetical protein
MCPIGKLTAMPAPFQQGMKVTARKSEDSLQCLTPKCKLKD